MHNPSEVKTKVEELCRMLLDISTLEISIAEKLKNNSLRNTMLLLALNYRRMANTLEVIFDIDVQGSRGKGVLNSLKNIKLLNENTRDLHELIKVKQAIKRKCEERAHGHNQ
ncbi:MAG: hypothetical protein ACXQTI_00685 [Candidatus Nezhaarchaeales archaeon]